tara:strand:- start:105 stop:335 length:231 start_codon:yes stop_codon:yes gene_type:complete
MISSSWFSQTKINQFSQAKLEDILAFILFCDSISQSLRILIAKFKACDGFVFLRHSTDTHLSPAFPVKDSLFRERF